MELYEIEPTTDPRWLEFIQRDRRASIFHTSGWLRALQGTYGYKVKAFTTCSPRHDLTNSIVFCEIRSWLTGNRMVSLPFSDHCDMLVDPEHRYEVLSYLTGVAKQKSLRYIEIRPREPLESNVEGLRPADTYAFHVIDLRRSKDELLQNFHKDSIRRKIQRAEREGLTYKKDATAQALRQFYDLFLLTRKRQGVPPTPFKWFTTLAEYLRGSLEVRIAYKADRAVAALLTLSHGKAVVYKYGASDARFNSCGGTPFLFWQTILEAKAEGFEQLDLGRSDTDNPGLITFKDRLGAQRSSLSYWRLSTRQYRSVGAFRSYGVAKKMFECAPRLVSVGVGKLMYKHLG